MQFIRVYKLAIVYMQIQFIINRKKLCAQYRGRKGVRMETVTLVKYQSSAFYYTRNMLIFLLKFLNKNEKLVSKFEARP